MKTVIYSTTQEDLAQAAAKLASGGLVAFPTETVYGLGADAFNKESARNAYKAKGRPSDNPLIVHISKITDVDRLAENYDKSLIEKLAAAFWPGPLTVILPKKSSVPFETTGGLDTVAIRMPASDETLRLIELSGTLLAGPSANLSGHPSPTEWTHVRDDLDGLIDGIIAGKPCSIGIESTVLKISGSGSSAELTILRPGYILPEMIAAVSGLDVAYDPALFKKPSDDPDFHPQAPGQKYRHYAPRAEMHIVPKEKLMQRVSEEESKGRKVGCIPVPEARSFFAILREFDARNVDIILAGALEKDDSLSFSIMNRVLKSAGYNIED